MPRKTNEQRKAESEAARLAARPFAHESTAPFAALPADEQESVAHRIAQAKLAGASGNEMRAEFGERLSGPARRKVLRAHGFDGPGYVARSYDSYRDGETRQGTRHAREHGAQAEARRAEARQAAEAELAEARKAAKGRSKAAKAAYAARVAEAEAMLASIG